MEGEPQNSSTPEEEPPRFPRRVFETGKDPDPRFTLANERTFLAWIRTSLAFLAGGVALEALQLPVHPGFRLAAALLLVFTGVLIPFQAWFGWARTEKALRDEAPLAPAVLSIPIAVSVLITGILVLIGLILW